MSSRAIVPIKVSLTEGDFYTLWAPKWRQQGTDWQALLGDDDSILGFRTEAELLTFIESGKRHDLSDHPEWEAFNKGPANRVSPDKRDIYDLIAVPEFLAGRPSHENVSAVARNFEMAEVISSVTGAQHTTIFFASHSILRNASRGLDHFSGEQGLKEWTAIGRVVLNNWKGVIEDLDEQARIVSSTELDEKKVTEAASKISAANQAAEEKRKKLEEQRKEQKEAADPYDGSPWAAAGIDPVKITVDSKSVYTLRTYLGSSPVFLGKWGEIFTFPTSKQLMRWIMENDDHDLARVSTWEDLVTAAMAGELEFSVHPDNQYTFNGIVRDITTGPDSVDTDQMSRCYEVCADAADWAGDDSINSFMLANPRFQDYLGYMLGSTETAGYVPSKPYNDHAEAWKGLEEMLTKRFSKF
ncbi:hypothetical protein ACG98H_03695 [Corynebacterium sp. L4756]|uniref:hypothetical protein n=1 Tax=unclassified Corynebacterium TaxID=2624378 RepID=UPI00374D9DF5